MGTFGRRCRLYIRYSQATFRIYKSSGAYADFRNKMADCKEGSNDHVHIGDDVGVSSNLDNISDALIAKAPAGIDKDDKIKILDKMFEKFDVDKDGYLNDSELTDTLKEVGVENI